MNNLQKIDDCGCVEIFLDSMNDCTVHICEDCMGYLDKYFLVGDLISLALVLVALAIILVTFYISINRY